MTLQLILGITNFILWIINSISFWQVGIKMSGYPIFANWIGIIPYIFFIPIIYKDKDFNWKKHLLYFFCTLFSVADSILEILADSYTGGVIQSVCSAAIPIPFTALLIWIVFKRKLTIFEIIGSIIVIGASFLLIFESIGTVYLNWWIIGYIVGIMLGCFEAVIWEYMFIKYNVNVFVMLAWTTIYSLPLFFISIFVNGSEVWNKQRDGFDCFIGKSILPPNCLPNAWIPLVIYSLSSIISDIVQMYFVKNDSAYFLIIADSLTTPITSIIISFKFIFGNDSEPLKWYSIVSSILILIGILIYKYDELKLCLKKKIENRKDEELLIN